MNPPERKFFQRIVVFVCLFVFTTINAMSVFAGPSLTTYQAKIITPTGDPLEAANVSFKFSILNPAETCTVYSETYSAVNMTGSRGLISFALGSGVRTYPTSGTITFEKVFANSTPSLACDTGGPPTYSPGANDVRKIVMQFFDGTVWQTLPPMAINAVPYAMYANDSQKLNGKADTSFVEVANIPTCGAFQALYFNGATFSCVSTQTTSATAVIAALGYTPANAASLTTVTSSIGQVSSTVAAVSSSLMSLQNTVAASFAAISAAAGVTSLNGSTSATQTFANGVTGTAPSFLTVNGVHTLNIPLASAGSVTAGLISNFDYLNFAGKITSSSASIAQVLGYVPVSATSLTNYVLRSNNLSDLTSSATARANLGLGSVALLNSIDLGTSQASGTLSVSRLADVGLGVVSGTQYTKVTVDGKGRVVSASQLSSSDVTNALGFTPTSATAGITSLNGSTSATQTFATSATGTTPAFVTSNGVHTLNIPLASAGSVTAGLISNSDYLNFAGKITSSSASIAQVLGYMPVSATSLTSYVLRSNDLSDLASSATARTNLGLGVLATLNSVDLSSSQASGTLAIARLADVGAGVTSGTQYTKVTVDGKGRIVSASQLSSTDITNALGFTPSSSGSGITSFNGSTAASQSFTNGFAGTAPQFDTALGLHTLNIPLASAGSVTAGLISNLDYLNFSGKITSSSASIAQVLGYVPVSATSLTNYVLRSNDLSDLTSATVARTNLGLGLVATLNSIDLGSSFASGTLSAARLPAFSGDASSVSGSAALTLASVGAGVTSGTQYTKVTVDGKGRVVSASQLSSTDITNALGFTPSSSGSGLTSLNGSTSATQTFATSATGTAPLFSTTAGVHTLNIPLASAASVTAGLISNFDYLNFAGKITSSSASIAEVLGYAPVSSTTLTNYVLRSNNLSDLASSATARTNLGLGTLATLDSVDLGSSQASGTLPIARLPDVGASVTSGTQYTKVTVDGKGRVVSAAQLSSTDITNALGFTPSSSGSGIISFNGSTSSTQTFATSATGTAPLFSTTAGVHTLNIPLASAGSVTAGLISNADYLNFAGKITSSSASIAQVLGYMPVSATTLSSYVLRSNDLSDLASATVARTNLGLGVLATLNSVDLGSTQASGTLAFARLADVGNGVTSGSQYTKVTVDSKGRVVSAAQLSSSDVTAALGFTPSSATVSSQWVTSGTTISYNTGHVGIGTSTPRAALDVGGTGAIIVPNGNTASRPLTPVYGMIRYNTTTDELEAFTGNNDLWEPIYTGSVGNAYWGIDGNLIGQDRTIGAVDNYGFGLITGGQNRLQVTASGNVGIGTTTPSAKLHLASGTSTLAPFRFTSGTLLTSPASGSVEYDGFNLYYTDGTNTRRSIATTASAGSFDSVNTISNTSNITLAPTGSVIVSSTTASTSSNTGALRVSGGLGVAGSIFSSGTIITSSNIQGASITATNGVSTTVITGVPFLALNPYGGSVAVGTTSSPVSRLDVRNSFSLSDGGAGGNNTFTFRSTTNSSTNLLTFMKNSSGGAHPNNGEMIGEIRFHNNGIMNPTASIGSYATETQSITSGGTDLRFSTTSNASISALERLRITDAGNVGIGTTTPTARLTVSGTGATSATASLHVINGASSSLMYVRNDGFVGIGTTTPSSRFQIGGTLGINQGLKMNNAGVNSISMSYGLNLGWNGTDWQADGNSFTNGGALVNADTNGNFSIVTVPSTGGSNQLITSANLPSFNRFVIQNNGNVGVGTTTPTAKLQLSSGTSTVASFKLTSGTLLTSPSSGSVEYDGFDFYFTDGTNTRRSLSSYAGVTSAVTSINGSTSATQTFATSATGTTPAFVTSNGVHTLYIPLASAGSVTAGLISNTDYLNFSGKITSSAASIAQVLGYVPASTASATQWMTSGTTISYSAGNVGVRTTNPTTALQLGSGVLSVPDGTASNPSFAFSSSLGTGMYMPTNGQLSFVNGGVQYLNITPFGTVDIPLSTASGGKGSGAFTVSGGVGIGTNLNVGGNARIYGTTVLGDTGTDGVLRNFQNDMRTILSGGNPWNSGANIILHGGTHATAAGAVVFNSGAVERMRIDGSGNVSISTGQLSVASGNVGIGTTTPNSKLEVRGGAITAGPIAAAVSSAGQVRFAELAASGNHYVGFRAPDAIASDIVWQLPAADGTADQVLTTDGAGILSWKSAAGGGGPVQNSATSFTFNTDTNSAGSDGGFTINNRATPVFNVSNAGQVTFGNPASFGSDDRKPMLGILDPRTNYDHYGTLGQRSTFLTPNTLRSPDTSTYVSTADFVSDYLGNATLDGYYNFTTNASTLYIKGGPKGTLYDGGAETGLGISNSIGLKIDPWAAVNTGYAYGLHVGAPTGGSSGNYSAYFAGRVGIGTLYPSQMLEVNGNVRATTFISTSDERLKKDIKKMDGLEIIKQLTGVSWLWKQNSEQDAGVIAQQLEKVLPFAVITDPVTGYKAVKYNTLIAPLIESTKELVQKTDNAQREIASLQSQYKDLKQQHNDLEEKYKLLQMQNNEMKDDLKLIKNQLKKMK